VGREIGQKMLMEKMSAPYTAAIGGYLLLRLERYDLMHNWARNLADRESYRRFQTNLRIP